MPFKIQERFEVRSTLERVWEFMIDPSRVVVCIPGAELLESREDRTFVGSVKVKVGPITSSYKGLVKFTEVDEAAHQVRITGEGREAGGAGSARVTMLSRVTALDTGAIEVLVDADVDLVGKIVQFGRGMIEEVSRQLFRQFSSCVKQQLEKPVETPPSGDQPDNQPVRDSSTGGASSSAKPVNALSLLARALREMISRSMERLFGRKST